MGGSSSRKPASRIVCHPLRSRKWPIGPSGWCRHVVCRGSCWQVPEVRSGTGDYALVVHETYGSSDRPAAFTFLNKLLNVGASSLSPCCRTACVMRCGTSAQICNAMERGMCMGARIWWYTSCANRSSPALPCPRMIFCKSKATRRWPEGSSVRGTLRLMWCQRDLHAPGRGVVAD